MKKSNVNPYILFDIDYLLKGIHNKFTHTLNQFPCANNFLIMQKGILITTLIILILPRLEGDGTKVSNEILDLLLRSVILKFHVSFCVIMFLDLGEETKTG